MKKLSTELIFCIIFLLNFINLTFSQEKNNTNREISFTRSLHYTNKGLEYLYTKEAGGYGLIMDKTAKEYFCNGGECHIKSCDVCHKIENGGKFANSFEPVKNMSICDSCHSQNSYKNDVHVKRGKKCLECHTSRDIHGDGTAYNTFMQPGVIQARCENCHSDLNNSESHKIHKDKVSCRVCHSNARFTGYSDNNKKSIQLKNINFLVNHNNKVSLADFHSLTYEKKSMIIFTYGRTHNIQKEGKKCKECHNTKITNGLINNSFQVFKWANDTIVSPVGIIPVIEKMDWNFIPLHYKNKKWQRVENPEPTIIGYPGYCTPLTKTQLEKLDKKVKEN